MATARPQFELTVDQTAVQKVARACKAEADGKALRKDLLVELRAAVTPGVQKVQSRLRAIPHRGPVGSPPLGSYLAARVRSQVRLTGRATGVKVRMRQTPALRGFKMASKRLNRTSWRHRVFGKDVWVVQESPIPGFFDETLADGREEYRAGVLAALEKMARRIAQRAG